MIIFVLAVALAIAIMPWIFYGVLTYLDFVERLLRRRGWIR